MHHSGCFAHVIAGGKDRHRDDPAGIKLVFQYFKEFQSIIPVNIPTEYSCPPLNTFEKTRFKIAKVLKGFRITQRKPRIDDS